MRWTLKSEPDPRKTGELAESLGVDPLIATLLLQRGIKTFDEAKAFFRPSLSQLHDPFLMKDMDRAVTRIETAIDKGEKIIVFGDYDVDGTSAVALVASYLRSYYTNVDTYIPDRYDEGYGVSIKGIDYAADNGFSLIIALDCGIKAADKVAYASKKDIDFVICDHHRPGDEIPKAVAVLDPKRADCSYPYDELCGCGIGFKLIQALTLRKGQDVENLRAYLDLVATAIAADIVPITGENRVLAYFGLEVINTNPRPGFRAIIQNLKRKRLTVGDVVFIIAPRINAAGRMEHGRHAVGLMTETDPERAAELATGIEAYNTDRKDTDSHITVQALEQIDQNGEQERYTTVVYDPSWHKGVIGIVASRLTETYYRPTIVMTKTGSGGVEKLAGSARSVRHFDVYNAIDACSEHLEQFGGHKYAAGLTLFPEQYEAFKASFEKTVASTIDRALLTPEIEIDAELDLSRVTPKFFRVLKQFAPFGPGNMTPVFAAKGLRDTGWGKQVGEDGKHLRVVVRQNSSQTYTGIGFGLGDKLDLIADGKTFDAAFSLDENEWNGQVSIQLKVRDIKS